MKNTGYTYRQILLYLTDVLSDREKINDYNSSNPIKKKYPRISEDSIISLTYNLILDGIILKNEFLSGINNIKIDSNETSNVIINNSIIVEIKGITSKGGFVNINNRSYKSFAWIWFDLNRFFNRQDVIVVHIIKNPGKNLKAEKKSNLSFKKVVSICKKVGDYETIEFNTNILDINKQKINEFFS